jgi:hypothetical protein
MKADRRAHTIAGYFLLNWFWDSSPETSDQLPSSHLYLSTIAKDVKLIFFFPFFGFQ